MSEQDRGADARYARAEKLEALLPLLSGALDVRKVFLGMSAVIQEVIPHDTLSFALLTPDKSGVIVQASVGFEIRELPVYRFTDERERLTPRWQGLIAHDVEFLDAGSVRLRLSPSHVVPPVVMELRPGAAFTEPFAKLGVRSHMRVPIRSHGEPLGGVAFSSKRPDAYDQDDLAMAQRIADHVSLALAHQALGEEIRRTAQADERAAALASRVDALSRELERFSAHRALGEAPQWKRILADAARVAETETTVLITGESGTGKEVLARYLHRGSPRAKGPFIALNCAALPEQLLESELFGHERGAFTGALSMRAGRIEQAAGGVLFLDEVGEMAPPVQAKFLRVLQEREFQRVGGGRTIRADVRVIAATNRDPRTALREDLYYRLSVFEIALPPLRERREDILLLAEAFLEEIGKGIGRPAAGISEDARDQLLAHDWPGNVRELRNAIERAVILAGGGLVTREHLTLASPREPLPAGEPPSLKIEAVERDLVMKAMAQAANNKSRAARLLGLTRGQLYSLMRRHGLTDAKR